MKLLRLTGVFVLTTAFAEYASANNSLSTDSAFIESSKNIFVTV